MADLLAGNSLEGAEALAISIEKVLNRRAAAGSASTRAFPAQRPSEPAAPPASNRVAMARRLSAELEESEDLIRETLQDGSFWSPPRKCPDLRWHQYEGELAGLSPKAHKALADAYRKLNDLNWVVPRRASQVVPGVVLATGQGPGLDNRDRERLADICGVIRNGKEHLERFAAWTQ